MNFVEKIIDFIWPTTGQFTREQNISNEKTMNEFGSPEKIFDKINYIKDQEYIQKFADVAKNLYVDEEIRVKTIEGKLVTLLGATGLVITLIAEFSDKIHSIDASNTVAKVLISFWFLLTLVYMLTSAIHALRGLDRKAYHKLDVKDIIDPSFSDKDIFLKRIGSFFLSNRTKNYIVINEKVDSMVMALKYFKRGMVTAVITGILYMLLDNFKFDFLIVLIPKFSSWNALFLYRLGLCFDIGGVILLIFSFQIHNGAPGHFLKIRNAVFLRIGIILLIAALLYQMVSTFLN